MVLFLALLQPIPAVASVMIVIALIGAIVLDYRGLRFNTGKKSLDQFFKQESYEQAAVQWITSGALSTASESRISYGATDENAEFETHFIMGESEIDGRKTRCCQTLSESKKGGILFHDLTH